MRKFVTAAATALTLALGLASPALADHNNNPYQGGYQDQYSTGPYGNQNQYGNQYDDSYGDRFNDNRYRNYDFGRHNRNFDNWERGWNNRGYDNYRYQRLLTGRQLVRIAQSQGYYGLRGCQRARWGFGYRCFAFNHRGRPVMLRVNPYNGRIIDVRYI
jgi:hypothetical protein